MCGAWVDGHAVDPAAVQLALAVNGVAGDERVVAVAANEHGGVAGAVARRGEQEHGAVSRQRVRGGERPGPRRVESDDRQARWLARHDQPAQAAGPRARGLPLGRADDDLGAGQQAEGAHVVDVQVGEDMAGDRRRVDAVLAQPRVQAVLLADTRTQGESPVGVPPRRGPCRVDPGVDDDRALGVLDGPAPHRQPVRPAPVGEGAHDAERSPTAAAQLSEVDRDPAREQRHDPHD